MPPQNTHSPRNRLPSFPAMTPVAAAPALAATIPTLRPTTTRSAQGRSFPEGTSVHRKLPKVKRVQTDDERVDEDLSVAQFYLRDENYQGAYLRAKDAVSIQPDYSATHFALAEVAQKMKKKDEAIAEYQTYLKLDPDGEKAKEATQRLSSSFNKKSAAQDQNKRGRKIRPPRRNRCNVILPL